MRRRQRDAELGQSFAPTALGFCHAIDQSAFNVKDIRSAHGLSVRVDSGQGTHGDEKSSFRRQISIKGGALYRKRGAWVFIGLFIVRRSFGGNDSERFLRLGSAFVVAAPLPLALGIAGDVYVVFLKISHCAATAIAAALTLLLTMLVPWYFYPVWLRSHRG
jgi:hypothetical protein